MRIVALEGVNGCGKTAVGGGIQRALLGGGNPCFVADPAGFGVMGQLLRRHLVSPGVELDADLDAVLFTALRAEGARALRSTLASEPDTTLVLERWSLALAAYGAADNARVELIAELRELLGRTLPVDLTILLDLDGELAFQRSHEADDPNRFETRGAEYLESVAFCYREHAALEGNVKVVDSSGESDATLAGALAVLRGRWPEL